MDKIEKYRRRLKKLLKEAEKEAEDGGSCDDLSGLQVALEELEKIFQKKS